MLKIENTETYGWQAAIREKFSKVGVRKTYTNSYEAYVSLHGIFVSCGTFYNENNAHNAVVTTKQKLFEASVISNGDDPSDIRETPEKGYFASRNGNIYNIHGSIMVGGVDRCGYRHIIANKHNVNVHRLIALTFIPNESNLNVVNHIDGNKLNNRVDNLEWCTSSENTIHSFRSGLQKKIGSSNVYSEDELNYIKTHCNESPKDIAKKICRNKETVRHYVYKYRKEMLHD